MTREDVETIVVSEYKLELGGKVADRASEESVRDRRRAAHETRSGRDRDEACNGA